MSEEAQYKVKVTGPGLSMEQPVDRATANVIMNVAMNGIEAAGTATFGNRNPSISLSNKPPNSELTPKQFMSLKKPTTQTESVACLAYYLAEHRQQPTFKTKDISSLNTEAAQRPFSNTTVAVKDATSKYGYLSAAGGGKKQITTIGEAVVEALPDRQAVAAAIAEHRPSRKKRSRSKKSKT